MAFSLAGFAAGVAENVAETMKKDREDAIQLVRSFAADWSKDAAVNKAKYRNNTYYLNKASFSKATPKSFDYAILEKTKQINAIKLDIPWSDLGSWKEILKMYDKNKNKYIKW